MGWWRINCVEKGGLGPKPSGSERELLNALPGKDSAEDFYNGDEPADVMDNAIREIHGIYQREWTRPPEPEVREAVFNFCKRLSTGISIE